MTRKERFNAIIGWFAENRPIAQSELHFGNPYQLLVAVILSAQCTDKRVNIVTPPLFERFPTPESLAAASFDEVYPFVKSVSYPNAKARHLIAMGQMLVQDYGGVVPSDIELLMRMPGVGRKTANVIQALVFGKAALAVDTHVFRVSHRLGLVKPSATTPLAVERTLVKHIPQDQVSKAHFWLLYYGRYTCTSRSPYCNKCKLTDICLYYRENHR